MNDLRERAVGARRYGLPFSASPDRILSLLDALDEAEKALAPGGDIRRAVYVASSIRYETCQNCNACQASDAIDNLLSRIREAKEAR